jgi:hypothetical protein
MYLDLSVPYTPNLRVGFLPQKRNMHLEHHPRYIVNYVTYGKTDERHLNIALLTVL